MANKCFELKCKNRSLVEKFDNYCKLYVLYKNEIKEVLFDLEYFDIVSNETWFIKKSCKTYYAQSGSCNKFIHRLIMNVTDSKLQIDHINHNGLDNRKSNLRIVTNRENQKNLSYKSNNTSRIIGVRFNSQINCWQAQWRDSSTNKQMIKSFNINKYGNEKAKELAIKTRKEMEKQNGYLTGNN